MNKRIVISSILGVSLLVGGCASNPRKSDDVDHGGLASQKTTVIEPTTQQANERTAAQYAKMAGDDVVARVNGSPILMSDLMRPLIEAYGLNLLLHEVQLELAKQDATKKHITINAEDVARERDDTLAHMFKDAQKADYDQLLDQFLQQQRISRPEFDIVIQTNAYLRKIAEPELKGKINDETLQEAFRAQYGETVQARHIQCANLQEIAEAKRRLGSGEPFDKVAREMSRNQRTAGLGGELPPFSRATQGLPESFKDATFALKVGEISESVVQSDGAYHIIKLEQRFAPKAVKFEDVKEAIRADLQDRLIQQAIKELRSQLAQQAMVTMKIEDPTLRKQFAARMDQHKAEIKDRDQIRRELEKEREKAATQQSESTTDPLVQSQPSTNPTTVPASGAAPAQAVPPPATMPAR